jgi:hypothetical protein
MNSLFSRFHDVPPCTLFLSPPPAAIHALSLTHSLTHLTPSSASKEPKMSRLRPRRSARCPSFRLRFPFRPSLSGRDHGPRGRERSPDDTRRRVWSRCCTAPAAPPVCPPAVSVRRRRSGDSRGLAAATANPSFSSSLWPLASCFRRRRTRRAATRRTHACLASASWNITWMYVDAGEHPPRAQDTAGSRHGRTLPNERDCARECTPGQWQIPPPVFSRDRPPRTIADAFGVLWW